MSLSQVYLGKQSFLTCIYENNIIVARSGLWCPKIYACFYLWIVAFGHSSCNCLSIAYALYLMLKSLSSQTSIADKCQNCLNLKTWPILSREGGLPGDDGLAKFSIEDPNAKLTKVLMEKQTKNMTISWKTMKTKPRPCRTIRKYLDKSWWWIGQVYHRGSQRQAEESLNKMERFFFADNYRWWQRLWKNIHVQSRIQVVKCLHWMIMATMTCSLLAMTTTMYRV